MVFTAGDVAISRLGYAERKDIDGAPTGRRRTDDRVRRPPRRDPRERRARADRCCRPVTSASRCLSPCSSPTCPRRSPRPPVCVLADGRWDGCYALWSLIAVASAIAAAAGFVLLDGASPDVLAFMFAFAGGAMLTMVSTSMTAGGLRTRRAGRRPDDRARLRRRLRHQLAGGLITSRVACLRPGCRALRRRAVRRGRRTPAAVTGTARKTPRKPARRPSGRHRQGDHQRVQLDGPSLDPRLQEVALDELDDEHHDEHRHAPADAAVGDGEHDGDEPGDRRADERDVGAEERDHEDRRRRFGTPSTRAPRAINVASMAAIAVCPRM